MFSLIHSIVRFWFWHFLRMPDDVLKSYLADYDRLSYSQKQALAAIEALAED